MDGLVPRFTVFSWRLVQGKTVFMPGLLAKAHRGLLYVDDINLLDTELCQILLGIVADGWVNVQVGVGLCIFRPLTMTACFLDHYDGRTVAFSS